VNPGYNTKIIVYEDRTFTTNMLNFQNGLIISIFEKDSKIGPMLISVASGPVPSTSTIIPAKSEELFLKLLAENISSFMKGICLITANFEKSLDSKTTKQLMHEIIGEIKQ